LISYIHLANVRRGRKASFAKAAMTDTESLAGLRVLDSNNPNKEISERFDAVNAISVALAATSLTLLLIITKNMWKHFT
jgi:hypothetical protein